ncbi:hypothetical protein [Aridibaculum aurantiacum]|uniref:hypothetical protein n=1 Tax=Aridibaculum aurantiacum TaxID=2810307 RepID=UPI001A9782A1|nr:hypothetical protein [Aridibaculum aurantiacum]
MARKLFLVALLFIATQSYAQLSVIKMVGNDTEDYKLGAGLYLKAGYPITEGDDITFEAAAYLFSLYDNSYTYGTIMVPAKFGYRYTLNRKGNGFYVEPQVGYNLFGITALNVNGRAREFKYNGVVLGASTGYLFSLWSSPLDLNLHFETIRAKGGSNNYFRLGLVFPFSLKRRESYD